MGLLKRLVAYVFNPYDDLMPKVEEEKAVEIKPSLVVGEPVRSLAASILEMKDWAVEEEDYNRYRHSENIQFRHKHKELDVKFRRNHYPFATSKPYPKIICEADWMTQDEKEFMAETFHEYFRLVQEEADRQRQIALAAEREKFMVLVK